MIERVCDKKNRVCTAVMILLFVGVSAAIFWKCRYGFSQADEAFYPTTAYRFLLGDRILNEDWGGAQTSAVLIMPILWLYRTINGSMEGIYLFLRYLYTVLKIAMSMFIYVRLKKYSRAGAYTSALMFLIFAGYGIMAISYNTIFLGGAVMAVLLLLRDKDTAASRVSRVLSGVALSASVLGMPYNALLYIVYIIAVIVISHNQKRAEKKGTGCLNDTIKLVFSYKTLGFVTMGIAVCVLAFFAYVFSNTTVSQIIQALPHVFNDPTHPAKNLYGLTISYLVALLFGNHRDYIVFAGYLLLGVIVIAYWINRKRQQRVKKHIAAVGAATLLLLAAYVYEESYINIMIYVPNVLAVILFIMVNDERIKTMFATIVAPGIVVTYAEFLGSNTWFYGVASASCVATVGSAVIIVITIEKCIADEKNEQVNIMEKVSAATMTAFLAVVFIMLMRCRMTFVFQDSSMSSLTVKLTEGVSKGLIVTEATYDLYTSQYRDTEYIRSLPDDTNVAYFGSVFLQMTGTQRCALYLTYTPNIRMDELYVYYEAHPDKQADVIYVQNSYKEEMVNELTDKYGYSVEKVSTGWILRR